MGAEVRNQQGPVTIDGHESVILARETKQDAAKGWSIVARPYRHRPEDADLDNLGSSSCTCLLAGNRVLMADGSAKAIETVKVGDRVMTAAGAARVRKCETTQVGMARKVIEIRGIGDECLFITDDHPLWVSRPDPQGAHKEWWGTYNVHQVMYEMRHTIGYELREMPSALNYDLPERVAHVSGWLHVRPIFHHVDPNTAVHHLVVDSGCTFIAEGFPLFSHCLHEQGLSAPWKGLVRDEAVDRLVEALAV